MLQNTTTIIIIIITRDCRFSAIKHHFFQRRLLDIDLLLYINDT